MGKWGESCSNLLTGALYSQLTDGEPERWRGYLALTNSQSTSVTGLGENSVLDFLPGGKRNSLTIAFATSILALLLNLCIPLSITQHVLI